MHLVKSNRLLPVIGSLAEMTREAGAPFWSARLVTVAEGEEREHAIVMDAFAVIRWYA